MSDLLSATPPPDVGRGALIPRLERIMAFLSQYHPPLRFPADRDRTEEEVREGVWKRGGTTPSGRDAGDVRTATWFVGAKYATSDLGAPQRIVWIPPEEGQERFTLPDRAGYMQEREQPGGEGPDLGDRTFRRIMTRVVPVTADLWCNDEDDLDILIHWVASAVFCTNAGAAEHVGEKPVESGGMALDQMVQRGLRYRLVCNFVFPISAPYYELRKGRHVGIVPRFEGEGHAAQRAERRADVRAQEERTGTMQPHDLDVTPWRRRTFAPPSSEPVADPPEEGEEV